jgi:hypothetical protein
MGWEMGPMGTALTSFWSDPLKQRRAGRAAAKIAIAAPLRKPPDAAENHAPSLAESPPASIPLLVFCFLARIIGELPEDSPKW